MCARSSQGHFGQGKTTKNPKQILFFWRDPGKSEIQKIPIWGLTPLSITLQCAPFGQPELKATNELLLPPRTFQEWTGAEICGMMMTRTVSACKASQINRDPPTPIWGIFFEKPDFYRVMQKNIYFLYF